MNPSTHSVPPAAPVWVERLKICSYDVDFSRAATSASLCRYFLDAAWNHAEALGVGYRHLQSQDKFWVLSRLRLQVERFPDWGSAVTLRTWPRPVQSVFAMRDFELVDDAGARLAAGSSAWLILDAASKRPQRLSRLLPGLIELAERTATDRDPEKLPDPGSWAEAYSAFVRYTDIDVNRHVNSIRYIGWILDAYPFPFLAAHRVRTLEINYLGETLAGDVLEVRTQRAEPFAASHSLVKAPGAEVCRARVEWMPAASKGQSPPR